MEFGGVLLRVIRICKLVFDEMLLVDLGRPCTFLDLQVVPAEDTRNAFITNEILICIGHFTFRLHPIDVDHVGIDSIEDLDTGGSPKCMGVGKVGVCGHCFMESITVEPGKSGFDVPSHWELQGGCSKLGCVLQCLPDNVDGLVSQIFNILVGLILCSGTRYICK